MSLSKLLDHACNIYHIKKDTKNVGFDIKVQRFLYSDVPDLKNVPCHFGYSSNPVMFQSEPQTIYNATFCAVFMMNVDIRQNDMVVDAFGDAYIAERPICVRNHHQVVVLKRKESV